MRYKLLTELLPFLEEFESERNNSAKESELNEFIIWMMSKSDLKNNLTDSRSMPLKGDINAQITQLITLMYKYLKFYLKKGFEGTELSAPDDFGFLATLFLEGKMKKNELIEKNTMEFSSGMEVIKRLEKNNLLESKQDTEDKRAKIVHLTESGRSVFIRLLPIMGQIGAIATANLSADEKKSLFEIMNKLNLLHNPIFHEAKKESVSEIMKRII